MLVAIALAGAAAAERGDGGHGGAAQRVAQADPLGDRSLEGGHGHEGGQQRPRDGGPKELDAVLDRFAPVPLGGEARGVSLHESRHELAQVVGRSAPRAHLREQVAVHDVPNVGRQLLVEATPARRHSRGKQMEEAG